MAKLRRGHKVKDNLHGWQLDKSRPALGWATVRRQIRGDRNRFPGDREGRSDSHHMGGPPGLLQSPTRPSYPIDMVEMLIISTQARWQQFFAEEDRKFIQVWRYVITVNLPALIQVSDLI